MHCHCSFKKFIFHSGHEYREPFFLQKHHHNSNAYLSNTKSADSTSIQLEDCLPSYKGTKYRLVTLSKEFHLNVKYANTSLG
jgi:hypothetical protein